MPILPVAPFCTRAIYLKPDEIDAGTRRRPFGGRVLMATMVNAARRHSPGANSTAVVMPGRSRQL
jgi:hypothetical protein